MLNILCCVGQAAEGKFHLVLVCFADRKDTPHLQKSHRLAATSMVVGLGVARTARQEGGCFLEVSRNEEAWGIPPKHFLWLLLQARIGRVARTAGQAGEWSLEVSRNEEKRGILAKTVSVAFVADRDWTRCKDRWASR